MKKTLILTLCAAAAAPLFAGDSAPVTVITPAKLTAAPKCTPIDVEVAAYYGFAINDIYRHGEGSVKDIDVCGADLTLVHPIDKNGSVNLRLGYSFGDETEPTARLGGAKWETDVHTFYLMPGYRYTHELNKQWSIFAGGNLGLANVSVKDHYRGDDVILSAHDSDWGVAYSAEVGVRYKLSENSAIFAAYQLSGSSANPRPTPNHGDGQPGHQQVYSAWRLGYSHSF